MSFNRNDLQGDDDDFNFGDDFDFDDDAGGDDTFAFDDEPANILDDDSDAGEFGFESEDMPELSDDGGDGEQRGTSRTFVILAAIMILLFVLGLGAVVLISLNNNSTPTDLQLTATSIALTNAQVAIDLGNTQTAAPLIAGTQMAEASAIALAGTQTASAPTETPRPPTITPTFSPTPQPALDETQLAATDMALQTSQAVQAALDLTQTALAASPTPAQPSVGDVALTATALVLLLQPQDNGQGGGAAPTQEIFGPTAASGIPTALPQTGFFDDLAAGNANAGLIALMALGLIGVIGISRYLRTANNK